MAGLKICFCCPSYPFYFQNSAFVHCFLPNLSPLTQRGTKSDFPSSVWAWLVNDITVPGAAVQDPFSSLIMPVLTNFPSIWLISPSKSVALQPGLGSRAEASTGEALVLQQPEYPDLLLGSPSPSHPLPSILQKGGLHFQMKPYIQRFQQIKSRKIPEQAVLTIPHPHLPPLAGFRVQFEDH